MSDRTRTKVFCYCKDCNGALVDPRTKTKHMSKIRIIPEIEFDDETELTGNNDETTGNNDETTGNNDEMEFDDETDINNEMEFDDETGINDKMEFDDETGINDEMERLPDPLPKRSPERNYLFLTNNLPNTDPE